MVESPVRLRLSRAKGFNLQAASMEVNGLSAVRVTRPGKFGNPFIVGRMRLDDPEAAFRSPSARECVAAFRQWLGPHWGDMWNNGVSQYARATLLQSLPELHGKNLACWCEIGNPCHADVLLELANKETPNV